MSRHKDGNWNIPADPASWDQAQVAVLMDLRDELKRLNSVLHCPNFLGVPYKLDQIIRNTTKPRRRKRKAKP